MRARFANLFAKAVVLIAVSLMFASGVNAVQSGDVVGEDVEIIFSETDRITVDDVEYLYTFKGIRPYHYVPVAEDSNVYNPEYGEVETQFVIEKAIPLTGNYNVTINVRNLLQAFGSTAGHLWPYYSFGTNFYYTAASTIVIGDSCFEGNELIKSVCIIPDGTRRNLRIAKRSFYGAVNLRFVTVSDVLIGHSWGEDSAELFRNLQLKSIGESAFAGCENLCVLGCPCDELERIDDYAFNECQCFQGIVSYYDQLHGVTYYDYDDWCSCEFSAGTWMGGEWVEFQHAWYTPKLSYIGNYAFYNAGYLRDYEPGFTKWTFLNKDLEIGEFAFDSCLFLQEIHFPSNMERVAERSFLGLHGRSGLSATKLYFPDTLVSIEQYAFASSNVQVMHWPSSLREIGDSAFSGSSAKVDYYINSEKTAICASLLYEWTNGLPTTLVSLGVGVFSGYCQFGEYSDAIWEDGKIVAQRYSNTAIASCGSFVGTLSYPANIKSVPSRSFEDNVFLEHVILHGSVTNIGSRAFAGCSRLNLIVPSSVREVGENAGAPSNYTNGTAPGVKSVVFEGKPPKGIAKSGFLDCSKVLVPVEYASDWAPYLNPNVKLARKIDGEWTALGGSLVSAKIRDGVPNVMDITYKVTSIKPTAKVRLVAFKDGTRSFAKATIPATLVNDAEGNPTAGNVGDAVVPNVEHVVSWQVSSDWGDVKLAKISVEIFVLDDELLPLQLMALPANETRGRLTFSTNTQSAEKITNALYWLLASHESDLNLANGKLTRTDTGAVLANGTSVDTANALAYLYGKMGYGVLSGENLREVNSTVRLSLGSGAYAVKVEAE